MLDRRGLLIANSQGGSGEYVTDGLVCFLDGLNQGEETGYWVDTVGGYRFWLSNATLNNDNVQFSLGYAHCNDVIQFQTFECVIKFTQSDNYATLFSTNLGREALIVKNLSVLQFGFSATYPKIAFENNVKRSYSAIYNSNDGYSNIKVNNANATLVTSGGSGWNNTQNGTNIGYYSARYLLNAEVYALRLYNRALTDAERTQNYNLDVQRYGL